jgi:plasmid stabilization system protein ParE
VTYPVTYRPEAADDIEAAYDWYETQRAGLGLEFRAALADAEAFLTTTPEAFPVVYRTLRRILLRRFPYSVYFALVPEGVQIWGCIHQARHPNTWRSRGRAV